MTKPIAKRNVLDGIEEDIKTTEEQIYQLKMQFASFMLKGLSGEQRRVIMQQLSISEENLQFLKIRGVYALERTVC